MSLEIVTYGNPVLRAKGALVGEITEKIRDLAEQMLETMREANGIGLAAQQVGVPIQMAIVDVAGVGDRPSTMKVDAKEVDLETYMPLIFVNPKLELGKEIEVEAEGCLSFPEISGDIPRAVELKATVTLLDGKTLSFEASGLLARALQHEVDHLNGVLFTDRMNAAAKASLAGRLKRMVRGR